MRRRFKRTTDNDCDHPVAPNFLHRPFDAGAPSRRLVTDPTVLLIAEPAARLFLAAVSTSVRQATLKACRSKNAKRAKQQRIPDLARRIGDGYPAAAASVEGGLDETLTDMAFGREGPGAPEGSTRAE